jgi:hypothetical protein
METYKKYLGEAVSVVGGDERGKKHIIQIIRKMEGLISHLKSLENDLQTNGYNEWKKLASLNKKYDKFRSKFIDTYFSRR